MKKNEILNLFALSFIATAIAITVLCCTAVAQDYTLSIPADLGPEWNLCQFQIVSYGNNEITAVALAEMEQEFAGVQSLTSKNGYTVTWRPKPGGGGMIEVETKFRNQFWIDVGFCYWTKDHSQNFFRKIQGDLVGGSVNEEDLSGPYDGSLIIKVELCGGEVDYGEVERIQSMIEDATSTDPDAQCHFKIFDDFDNEERSEIWYIVNFYERSLREIGEHLVIALEPGHTVKPVYGNRVLYVSNCDQPALWYRVLKTDSAEGWGESYTGNRVFAILKDDGNIMVSYIAAINTSLLNIFGSSDPGTIPIGPVPESGSPDYWRSTFVIVSKGEGMQVSDMVRSVSGKLTMNEGYYGQNTMNGHFEVIGIDQFGRRRSIIGGFRNLVFPD